MKRNNKSLIYINIYTQNTYTRTYKYTLWHGYQILFGGFWNNFHWSSRFYLEFWKAVCVVRFNKHSNIHILYIYVDCCGCYIHWPDVCEYWSIYVSIVSDAVCEYWLDNWRFKHYYNRCIIISIITASCEYHLVPITPVSTERFVWIRHHQCVCWHFIGVRIFGLVRNKKTHKNFS